MDGNRRWAKERNIPSMMWHKAGADNVEKILKIAADADIEYLTLWALSTENIVNRTKEEVGVIIKLVNNIELFLGKALKNNVQFKTIGNLLKLPQKTQDILQKIKDKTQKNTGITIVLALVYGWQDEIERAAKLYMEDWGKRPLKEYMDTHFLSNPDLIVRTGWDMRHSGFLLFDSAYSEYYFTEKKWPEFNKEEFDKALESFNSSKRNFWK